MVSGAYAHNVAPPPLLAALLLRTTVPHTESVAPPAVALR